MVRRLFEVFTRRGRRADPGPSRPNQLRRDDVVAARRQRQARREPEPAVTPREQPPRRAVRTPPRLAARRLSILSSRAGVREALLAQEVLGPPLALRERDPAHGRW